MRRGRPPMSLDEHFFDEFTDESSYLYGAFIKCYTEHNEGFEIHTKEEELIRKIKWMMDLEHAIIRDPRHKARWIQVRRAPHLVERLGNLGLGVDREYRDFPDYDGLNLRGAVRGFIDAAGNINKNPQGLSICFHNRFLVPLNDYLAEHANTTKASPKGRALYFGLKDTIKIRDHLYSEDLKAGKHNLYLWYKKSQLDNLPTIHSSNLKTVRAKGKILTEAGMCKTSIPKRVIQLCKPCIVLLNSTKESPSASISKIKHKL